MQDALPGAAAPLARLSLWGAMLTMLNLRIVAAIAAAQIFVATVLWPDAPTSLGLLMGAGAGAAVFAVGRLVLAHGGLWGTTGEEQRRAAAFLGAATLGAAATVAALFFVVRGAAAGVPWGGVVVLALGLALLAFTSVRLTRLAGGAAPTGEPVDR